MTEVTARLNFRIRPEVEARLRAAAEAVDVSLTDFVISAAAIRADEVLATNTVVSEQFFKDRITPWMPETMNDWLPNSAPPARVK